MRFEMQVGDLIEVEIIDVAHGGHCIARVEDKVIFVRHSLPGEKGVVEITSKNSKIFRGDLVKVTSPSPNRIDAECEYARPGLCGGCAFAHSDLAYETSLKKKILIDQFAKIGKIDISHLTISSPGFDISDGRHWRRRMGFALTPYKQLGLHSARSNSILEIKHCYIANEKINDAAFPKTMNGEEKQEKMLAKCKDFSVPVEFAVSNNDELALTHRGKVLNQVHEITETVDGVDYSISPLSFWQSHDQAANVLVSRVNDLLDIENGDVVLDLYSGVGLFAGHMVKKVGTAGKVIMIESDSHSGRDAQENFKKDKRAEVKLGKVEDILPTITQADRIVLDPPRAGIAPSVAGEILRLAPVQILYISCDPATLARDVALLTQDGGYEIAEVNMYNLYPRTHHLESVVLLNKAH
jgi:tRNA/tmRNA/rRNA uracil-C5-methylase (TrmA/RlmC/RlmD family)